MAETLAVMARPIVLSYDVNWQILLENSLYIDSSAKVLPHDQGLFVVISMLRNGVQAFQFCQGREPDILEYLDETY